MNKKNILIIILFCLIVLTFVITFILINKKEDEKLLTIDEEDISYIKDNIEVYSDVKLSEIVKLNNYVIVDDFKIDTDSIGPKEVIFDYIKLDETKKGKIIVNIVDTTEPYIGIGDHYSHIINTKFTFYDDILCADNYDRDISCKIIGSYDISSLGETKLKIEAVDSSNNKTEKEFILKVIEKPKKDNNKGVIKIEDAIKNKKENEELMIDVSKWQKEIDWEKVKKSGVNYAMLRLGTQKALDKESIVDEYFERNIKEAQKNGIKVGVYYFSYANDINDAKEQAEWVIEQLKDYKLDLPISFDWESWKYFSEFHMNLHDINEIGKVFLDTLKSNGYVVMNYGSKNYLKNIWKLEGYYTWLAHYTDKTNYEGEYLMWQFTDSGRVNGINNNVDLNYINMDLLEKIK